MWIGEDKRGMKERKGGKERVEREGKRKKKETEEMKQGKRERWIREGRTREKRGKDNERKEIVER